MNRLKVFASILVLLVFLMSYSYSSGFGAVQENKQAIGPDQTEGFGEAQLLLFTYSQPFFCSTLPCKVGVEATSTPTGEPLANFKAVWVIVPFFDTDGDGKVAALDTDGEDTDFPTQCPEPGAAFGTCVEHPSELQLPLGTGGKLITTPLPKHSHVVTTIAEDNIPWIVIIVLVTDPAAWPDKDGKQGLTSLTSLRTAQAAGQASTDIPSNFFLFFDVKPVASVSAGPATVIVVAVVSAVVIFIGALVFYRRSKKSRITKS